MNAIDTYIEQMFRHLPRSAEIRRAKTELHQMSEDRYQQLRAEGVSEHEAVGRVITQFGNLDELADQLGIRTEVDQFSDHTVAFSDAEAERYVQSRRRASFLVAGGVALILVGIAIMSLFSADIVEGGQSLLNFAGAEPVGLAMFFIAVAIAVAMFIFAAVSSSRVDIGENKLVELSPEAAAHYRKQREDYTDRYGIGLAGGVVTIILAAAVMAVTSLTPDSGVWGTIGTVVFFLGVAAGVGILIVTGMRRATYDRLTSSGDYTPENLDTNRTLENIAGPYWMTALAVFLIWSFVWNAWQYSWMVWPIAGVLYGLLATIVASVKRRERA